MKKEARKEKRFTTSKCLTYIFTLFFISQVYLTDWVKSKYNIDLSFVLNSIVPLQTIIMISYFSKSGYEFAKRIQNSTNQIQQETSTPVNLSDELNNINSNNQINDFVYADPSDMYKSQK